VENKSCPKCGGYKHQLMACLDCGYIINPKIIKSKEEVSSEIQHKQEQKAKRKQR